MRAQLTFIRIRLRHLWTQERGQIGFWSIFGAAILVVAYLAYPDPFHDFIQFLINYTFDALNDSFSGDKKNSGGKPDFSDHVPGTETGKHSAPRGINK